jgi:cytochrome d ubiquinol oxidase subunit I
MPFDSATLPNFVPTAYPVNDYGPVMKGMAIGGLGIFHVFLAQFAIGGGFLLLWFEWLAQSGREPLARRLIDSVFRVLIFLSFVIGALTGVGMWLTSIQVSAPTIGLMVDEFHWIWATEWIFFWLEIVAGYAFFRYGDRLGGRERLTLLSIYSFAGFGSLFWINGILSWQLTPGGWVTSGSIWEGFFNPTFWPSLLFRTVVCFVLAALGAAIVLNALPSFTRDERARLLRRLSPFFLPMLAMPLLGAWYLAAMPADSRGWILGGSMVMTMFFNIAAGASALIGGYGVIALWRQKHFMNGATATLLAALAFGATGAGEFIREGARKPYSVRETLFSNAITPAQVATLRERGVLSTDPYPLADEADYPTAQLREGRLVYRNLCSVCHTIRGANALDALMGDWSIEQKRLNVAMLQWTEGFMPPFAGTAGELESLVQYIAWEHEHRPKSWPESRDPSVLAGIETALRRAGPYPAPRAQELAKSEEAR